MSVTTTDIYRLHFRKVLVLLHACSVSCGNSDPDVGPTLCVLVGGTLTRDVFSIGQFRNMSLCEMTLFAPALPIVHLHVHVSFNGVKLFSRFAYVATLVVPL